MEHEPVLVELTRAWRRKARLRRGRRYWVTYPPPDPALFRRSTVFADLRKRFGLPVASAMGDAISAAGLSFLGGAPRNPNLKVAEGSDYSTVKYAESLYAYTMVITEKHYCPRCGRYTLERHQLELRDPDKPYKNLGYVESCSHCDAENWMFKVHGPRTEAARKIARK